ncbi:recombinase family protein [Nocardioides sp.]|uniref:recombinase family protein n=1 Tax=Nocardioides sp. TaxID=35761 RepID=UPI00344C5064
MKWAAREGVRVVGDPIIELDASSRSSKKRAIARMIEEVREGQYEGIVVWKISRSGRKLIDSLQNVAELREAGGFIASATENLNDIETSIGKFSRGQMLPMSGRTSTSTAKTRASPTRVASGSATSMTRTRRTLEGLHDQPAPRPLVGEVLYRFRRRPEHLIPVSGVVGQRHPIRHHADLSRVCQRVPASGRGACSGVAVG